MNGVPKRRASVASRIEGWESFAATLAPSRPRHRKPVRDDEDNSIQGLTPAQIGVLAQKVYDLLLDEIRIEAERYGRTGF